MTAHACGQKTRLGCCVAITGVVQTSTLHPFQGNPFFVYFFPSHSTKTRTRQDHERRRGNCVPISRQVREEMNSIHDFLFVYRTQGSIRVTELLKNIVCFCKTGDTAEIVWTLQQRYRTLFNREVELVLSSKDGTAIAQLVARIRKLIGEIENVLFGARSAQMVMLPLCRASCYIKGALFDKIAPVLLDRFNTVPKRT